MGREEIPFRLRNLLNVESGLNDGLALPVVVVLLAIVGSGDVHAGRLPTEVVAGVGVGVVIPALAILVERTRPFSAATAYEPLNAFAIGLLVLGIASLTHVNEFLAAFAAGITVATMSPEIRDSFHEFGELVTELLKLAALLVFGALISPAFLAEIPVSGYVFAAMALLVTRPAALAVSLVGSRLSVRGVARRSLVRSQGLRVGGLRPAYTQCRLSAERRGLPFGSAGGRGLDRGPFLDRCRHRPLVRARTCRGGCPGAPTRASGRRRESTSTRVRRWALAGRYRPASAGS